jgi:hypothetical protein
MLLNGLSTTPASRREIELKLLHDLRFLLVFVTRMPRLHPPSTSAAADKNIEESRHCCEEEEESGYAAFTAFTASCTPPPDKEEATKKKSVVIAKTAAAAEVVPKTSRSGRRCVPPANDGVGKYIRDKK